MDAFLLLDRAARNADLRIFISLFDNLDLNDNDKQSLMMAVLDTNFCVDQEKMKSMDVCQSVLYCNGQTADFEYICKITVRATL